MTLRTPSATLGPARRLLGPWPVTPSTARAWNLRWPPGLWPLATTVGRTLADTHTDDPATQARYLNNLSADLSATGDRDGALAAIERAVDIHERLAEREPAAYEPALALSLNNLSTDLSATGDRDGALAASERAIPLITPYARPGTVYADWLAVMQDSRRQRNAP